MKKVSLPLLLIFSFTLFAQDDDYCPCQETQSQEAEFSNYFTSINNQVAVFIQEESSVSFIPETIEEPGLILIELPKEEKPKPEKSDKSEEIDEEDIEDKVEMQNEARLSSLKKVKKKKKYRIKRKKKPRKYQGKCPFF